MPDYLNRLKQHLARIYGRRASEQLDAVLGAAANCFTVLEQDVDGAAAQLDIRTAWKDFLDYHGEWYDIARKANETDQIYSARIIEETIRQRTQKHALEGIVKNALGITIVVQDLWPFVIQTDQWSTIASRPLQQTDGHLPSWNAGTLSDQAVRTGFQPPYLPLAFGVWISLDPAQDPFSYTIDDIKTLRPEILFNDAHIDSMIDETVHIADLALTDPTNAKITWASLPSALPQSVNDVMALIERHRAAGTEAVFMNIEPIT